jgi:hypothetical protein
VEDKSLREIEVLLEPSMVFKMIERADHLTPMWDAFATLCWISNDGTTLENKNIQALLR